MALSSAALHEASIAASALSAAILYELRGGPMQHVSVDERHVVLDFGEESCRTL